MGRPRDTVAGRNPWERPLSNDRRLSAPGQLSYADDSLADGTHAGTTVLPPGPLAEYAQEHGLRPSAARPPFRDYIRDLWRRWSFMLAFATARNISLYTEAKLGQLWQVLTPLLNAGVYFLDFGLMLHINRGIPNYLAFLVTGVFVFNFTQRAFITTSKVITDSLPLIRALQFPRAALPLAYGIIELQLFFSRSESCHAARNAGEGGPVAGIGDRPSGSPAEFPATAARARWPGSVPRSTTSASFCRSCCAPGCTRPG
jgi:hypothetical protein